jgi:regulator of CtrA degradation
MAVVSMDPARTDRVIETLYIEALVLADETRSYFDMASAAEDTPLDPATRVFFAREALKATVRLTRLTTWLAQRRAIDASGGAVEEMEGPGGYAAGDSRMLGSLPTAARRLILAGIDLHGRVSRLAEGLEQPTSIGSPARTLIRQLERAF